MISSITIPDRFKPILKTQGKKIPRPTFGTEPQAMAQKKNKQLKPEDRPLPHAHPNELYQKPVIHHVKPDTIPFIKTRHITTDMSHRKLLPKLLKPGDIVFYHTDFNDGYVLCKSIVDTQIRYNLIQRYPLNMPENPYRFMHTFMYIGKGKVAETRPDPDGAHVRIIDLDDPFFNMVKGSREKCVVFRPKDAALGKKASQLAYEFATPYKVNGRVIRSKSRYDYKNAGLAAVFGPELTQNAVKRFIKAGIYGMFQKPYEGVLSRPHQYRPFSCCFFIAWCYQAAEGPQVFKDLKIPIQHNELSRDHHHLSPDLVSRKAKKLAKSPVVQERIKQTTFNVNAKYLLPIDMLNIVLNSGKFDRAVTITAEPAEPKA